MIEIILKYRAQIALNKISFFVEDKNTPNSGIDYIEKFASKLKRFAQENTHYSLCNNTTLAMLGYSCATINKWIVAFKIKRNKFIVYRIFGAVC